MHKTEWRAAERYCAVAMHEELEDECAVPLFKKEETYDPPMASSEFQDVLAEYKSVFSTNPGNTCLMQHNISTSGCHPARVPPRSIPAHYRAEVEKQLDEMIAQGIICRSTSSWVAPAVYVRKKTGELRICVDYRELNKRMETTAYSLPLPDEAQDRLAGASIFTKLDFKSGFWQVAMDPDDAHKTAFSPRPGMGLFEFNRMPFGLNGAPGTKQRLMDKLLEGMNCAMGYIDDILVYSSSVESHKKNLRAVLKTVKEAGITLQGSKCRLSHREGEMECHS